MTKYTFPTITVLIIIIAVIGLGAYLYQQNTFQLFQSGEELTEINQPDQNQPISTIPQLNPIDQSIRNPLSEIENPLSEVSTDLLDTIPSSPLDEVDYNPFS